LTPLLAVAVSQSNKALNTAESWLKKAREAQERKQRENPEVKAAEEKTKEAWRREQVAQCKVDEAKAKEQQLQEEARNLAPERRISRFIEERAQSSDYRGQLGIVSLARRDFEELSNLFAKTRAFEERLEKLKQSSKVAEAQKLEKLSRSIDRIVLFVDDLDRCQPDKVVEVLQAVHLLLAFPLFAVVVGVDQRCLRQSLKMQFRGLLTPDTTNGNRAGESKAREPEERPATPLDYLEKIFHIPFHLPPMDETGFKDLIDHLGKPKKEPPATRDRKPEEQATKPPVPSGTSVSTEDGGKAADAAPPSTPEAATQVVNVVGPPPASGIGTEPLGTETSSDQGKAPPSARQENPSASTEKKRVGSAPLHDWERNALKKHHAIISTPRGATRLLNTYRLVRAGVPKDEWKFFCGDQEKTGEFRVVMLLLAVSAGRPSVARNWFSRIAKMRISRSDDLPTATESEVGVLTEWETFVADFDQTIADLNPQPKPDRLEKWFRRVERYTF
jgi:hypothetical protein